MGILDGTGNQDMGFLSSPYLPIILGALQGYGQAMTPSRLPVTPGMQIGNVAGGMLSGLQQSNVQGLQNIQLQQARQQLYWQQHPEELQKTINDLSGFGGSSLPPGPLSGQTQTGALAAPGTAGPLSGQVNPASYLQRTQQLETGGNPAAAAANPYQMQPSTAQQMGGTGSAEALQLAANNAKALKARLGRDPTLQEVYLAHQQGGAGAGALLSNPDAKAVDVLTPLYGSPERARDAIVNNGGTPDMTAGEFAQMWGKRFSKGDLQSVSDLPPPQPQQGTPVGSGMMSPGTATALTGIFPQGKEIFAKMVPGPTDLRRAMAEANVDPNSPYGRALLEMGAQKAAGGGPINVRQGGAVLNPVTGRVMFQNPVLGEGVRLNPQTMGAETVSGYTGAAEPVRKMEAGAKATFEPQMAYDAFGNPHITNRAVLGNAGQPQSPAPQSTPLEQKAAAGQPTAPGDVKQATLADVIPPGTQVPQPPAPPPGTLRGPPNEAIKEAQKEDVARLSKYQNQMAEGQKIYVGAKQILDTLNRGLSTGRLDWSGLANAAQQMGLGSLIPEKYDPADAGVFDKVATDMVFASLKQLPGQVRVAEIEGLQRANPNRVLPRAANIELLHTILANQQWMDKRADLATQYWYGTGGAPLGFFDSKFNERFPLSAQVDHVFDTARAAGWRMPGDVNEGQAPSGIGGAGNKPAATAPIAPAVKEGDIYHNPKTGERIILKGGQWQPLQ